jgi:hypothetical protein
MKIGNCLLVMAVWALSSAISSAQNNCSNNPPTGTCPALSAPVQVWCAGNNSSSTCPGGTAWVGFDTSTPASGSWTQQLEGLDASSILKVPANPRPQPDPNGAVGPTNASGVGQYLEFADNYVQAFDRATGNGILSKSRNSGAEPQPLSILFSPGGTSYCGNGSVDGTATYDWIDKVFVLANIFNPGSVGTFYYCIGVSAASGSVPASNLEGNNFQSHWNVYAYQLNPAIPINPNTPGKVYFPDYARFGTWSDGFYVAWDLEDPSQNYAIVGFEVCKLGKANIVAGLSSIPPTCSTYIPSYAVGQNGTDTSLIHTLLPADFEGDNPIPSDTAGEYFVAQVNPNNRGTNNQCTQAPCKSALLAFWTWAGIISGAGPTYINLSKAYIPGCYDINRPYDTTCIPEPYGGVIDSVGDRLMSRLAYRYLTTSTETGEYLAVAHTIQQNATFQRTGIRYYQIKAGTSPTVELLGALGDAKNNYFYSMPSVAMDGNGDLGITFTVTGNTSHGSHANYDPSPFFITVNSSGIKSPQVRILSNSGSSGQDETNDFWGEYISVSSDPDDDLTFWAVDQYMNGNQIANCTAKVGTGCTWATRIYTCKKGSGC